MFFLGTKLEKPRKIKLFSWFVPWLTWAFRFEPTARETLFILHHLLRLFAEIDLDIPPSHDAVEALLAANVIQEFLDVPYLKADPRFHFLLGLLYLSKANNLVYNFGFPQAHEEAQKWKLSIGPTSRWQVDMLWDQVYCAGRIFKGEGRFEEAEECFEHCLRTSGIPESKRVIIKSSLADLHCELGYQRKQNLAIPEI